jgi:adenosylcobyric acid synthase
MVLGCTSSAGKSLLVTALARWFSRQGVAVAPFKAQNMSNNARVVDGGEIGVAQWLQARAARVTARVDLNPVLLKPEADTRSQVVVGGEPQRWLTEMPWGERGPHLWPAMAEAYGSVAADAELVLLEGAGSPAEINLVDLVNNRMVEHADAAAVLVADIDRGGAFAHLYGTWSLVPVATRERLGAFVLNKFRGDASLLAPGPARLTELTSMPFLGLVPMLAHHLPDEEGAPTSIAAPPPGAPVVGVVTYPFASNLDELHLLPHVAFTRWVREPSMLAGCDLVILPGSKHVAADRAWLAERGFDEVLRRRTDEGGRIVGVCGGAMLLGGDISDPSGVEGSAHGLDLLPIRTEMAPAKVTRAVDVHLGGLREPWTGLGGCTVAGYEIRHGRVWVRPDPPADLVVTGDGLAWALGSVLATTVHGLLEDPAVVAALLGTRPMPVLDRTFEALADAVDEHLDTELLWSLVNPRDV